MKYQISITGMHCKGCASLIKMSLEDQHFEDVTVDIKTQRATFVTLTADHNTLLEILHSTFADLPGYEFSNLTSFTS